MLKTIHSPHNRVLREKLVEMRKAAGLTHRQLAAKLNREPSFVWRIENGERRVDVVEFYFICKALGVNPEKIYAELAYQFSHCDA